MQQPPVPITFRHMSASESVRTRVLELFDRLQRFNGHITGATPCLVS